MKKILYAIALSMLVISTVSAQKDAKAKELLDKTSQAYSEAGDMTVYFSMNIKDPKEKVTEGFDGEIKMKGKKLLISTPDADTWFDGKTQWVYMKGYDEVNVSEPSGNEAQALNPATILSIYKKGCNYRYLSEKTDSKNRNVYEVEIIPQSKNGIKKIIIQINKSDYIPVMFHVFYKNDIENLVYVNKYQTRLNHPDNLFVFDKTKYPKAEIIDLR